MIFINNIIDLLTAKSDMSGTKIKVLKIVVVRRNIKDRQRLMLIQNQDSTHNFMPIRMRIQTKTRQI